MEQVSAMSYLQKLQSVGKDDEIDALAQTKAVQDYLWLPEHKNQLLKRLSAKDKLLLDRYISLTRKQ